MLLALGCEQTPAPSALSPAQPVITQSHALAQKSATAKKRINQKVKSCGSGCVSTVMGEKGGRLALCDYEMDVPRGALSEEREMSIKIIENAGNYYEVDFRPHLADFGADGSFKKPVKITIHFDDADLSGIDPETLTIVWHDEAAGEWIEVESEVDAKKNKIVAHVWHFTEYSISTR